MKKREIESPEDRSERLEKNLQDRKEQASAQDKAVDAAIRRSIKQFGA